MLCFKGFYLSKLYFHNFFNSKFRPVSVVVLCPLGACESFLHRHGEDSSPVSSNEKERQECVCV